ncbi:MAG: triose-phosphate isomerase [Flavobacteriales bacterium]|nr:triose-phosphate isomerase [Flavobacteriales bacterium]
MRKKILAGNWKMNTNISDGLQLFLEVKSAWSQTQSHGMLCIIAPPSTHLAQFSASPELGLHTAGQNCSEHEAGAFTGETSAAMLKSVKADYVILGHSERRALYGEDNTLLKRKVDTAFRHDLIPIYCCGELEHEREAGMQNEVVKRQLEEALFHLNASDFGKVVVAYEPVWAIGTGKTATPVEAQEIHSFIRSRIEDRYNKIVAMNTSILYGGSCNPNNADDLFAKKDVDGGLIGGASLNASDFMQIANSLSKCI